MNFLKRILCFVILASFIGNIPVMAIGTSAEASVAIDALTGEIICEKNAYMRLGMASTTKIMTAILALEHGGMDEVVKIDPRAIGVEGSSLYLEEGDEMPFGSLLYAMMLRSANDGATAVALHLAPSVEEFAEMMTEKARSLGLRDTNFKNPHGLHQEGHYTSAYDLAQITRYGFTLPGFAELVSSTSFSVDADVHTKHVTNNNKLLNMYEGADGVKTGYTPETGRTLVGSATRDGMRIITVTLNDREDWNDHVAMFDYGFENFKSFSLAQKGHGYGCVQVKGAEASEIAVVAAEDFGVLLNKGATVSTRVSVFEEEIKAPVEKGRILGRMDFYREDDFLGSVDLVAAEDMPREKKPNIFWRIINWIMGK